MAPLVGLRIAAKQGQASGKGGLEATSCLIIKLKNSAGKPVTLCPKAETITLATIKSDVKRIVEASWDLQPKVSKFLSNIRIQIKKIKFTETCGREVGKEASQTRLITKLNTMQTVRSKREKCLRKRIKKLINEAQLVQMVIVKIGMKRQDSSTGISEGKDQSDDVKCVHNFPEVLKHSNYLKRCIRILEGYSNLINMSVEDINKWLGILSNSFRARHQSNLTAAGNIIYPSGQNKPPPILKKVKQLSVAGFVEDERKGGLSERKRININIEQNTLRLIPIESTTLDSGFTKKERDMYLDVFSFQHVEDLFKVPFGIRNEPKKARVRAH